MNKKIKELLKQEEGMLKINNFCTLHYVKRTAIDDWFGDECEEGHLWANFSCSYGKASHSVLIGSREPNEIKETLKKEQAYFFNALRNMLNRQIDGGYIG